MIIRSDGVANFESLQINDVPDDDGGLENAGDKEEEDNCQKRVDSVGAVMTIVGIDNGRGGFEIVLGDQDQQTNVGEEENENRKSHPR